MPKLPTKSAEPVMPINLDPGRPILDAMKELNVRLKEEIPDFNDIVDYFSLCDGQDDLTVMPEMWRWIACFAVRGGSEGYYVHIEVIFPEPHRNDGTRKLLALAKCWKWDDAFKIANAATRILYE